MITRYPMSPPHSLAVCHHCRVQSQRCPPASVVAFCALQLLLSHILMQCNARRQPILIMIIMQQVLLIPWGVIFVLYFDLSAGVSIASIDCPSQSTNAGGYHQLKRLKSNFVPMGTHRQAAVAAASWSGQVLSTHPSLVPSRGCCSSCTCVSGCNYVTYCCKW